MTKALRGDRLRHHILHAAKDVFLEVGFERASMEAVASRAETTKMTLYAHFKNKEKLYLEVVEYGRGTLLSKLKTPADYLGTPAEKLVTFCGLYVETLVSDRVIRMCRLNVAEAARFPEGSAKFFEVVFLAPHERLSAYLKDMFDLSAKVSSEAAQKLLGEIIYPRFLRALFCLDELSGPLDDEPKLEELDFKPIRKAVAEFMESPIMNSGVNRHLG